MIIQIVVQNAIRRSGLFKSLPNRSARRKDKASFILYLFAIGGVIATFLAVTF